MYGTEYRFDIGDRVRLRDGVAPGAYQGMAKVGNEGHITGRRRDRFGLPEVFIKWDPNHWAYNRQPDGWTYQDHFDPVKEEGMSEENDKRAEAASKLAQQFADGIAALFKEQPPPPAPEGPTLMEAQEGNPQEDYAQAVQASAEAVANSEAFLTIAISRQEHDQAPRGVLVADIIGDSLSPDSEILLGVQASQIGSQSHRNLAVLQLKQMLDGDVDGSGLSG